MQKPHKYIGFNDHSVMLFIIPVLAFLIPIIFFGRSFTHKPFYTTEVYVTTLIMTLVIWVGNRYILIMLRKKYNSFVETKKRLCIQSIIMIVYTIIATTVLHFVLIEFCGFIDPVENADNFDPLFSGIAAALLCTLTAIATYEGIYFLKQLKESIQETESLKRENLKAQLDALKTQVNPHFLFNNLNTLSSLIPENSEHAVAFVQQLSKVYRHILEVKDEKAISLKDELEVIEAYSFLLKTRFENNLHININIPAEKLHKKIVPLSLQLLIENAIKHNIVSAEKPLYIDISSNNGSIVVDNNLQIKKQIFESTGIGLENIQKRYKLLSNKKVVITNNELNFTVAIPLIEN